MLNIQVADVQIDMGSMVNSFDKVRITFRRPPDSTVVQEIMKLKSDYGWEIRQPQSNSDTQKMIWGDFTVICLGAKSDEVGNAIGQVLEQGHGLKVMYGQFVATAPGHSKFTHGVPCLDLSLGVVSHES